MLESAVRSDQQNLARACRFTRHVSAARRAMIPENYVQRVIENMGVYQTDPGGRA